MLGICFSLMLDVLLIADDKRLIRETPRNLIRIANIVIKKSFSQVAAIKTYNHRGMIHAKKIRVAPRAV